MGNFKNINLLNFRNFQNYNLEFSKTCNIFFGKNGSGKTNLLESISLFSKGRGIKKDKIINIINTNYNNFIINSEFNNKDIKYNLTVETIKFQNTKKKLFKINNDSSKDVLNSFYEKAPLLTFVPETERIFLSSPSKRRNIIDSFIFVYKYDYNKLINNYLKNVFERSKLLKNKKFDIEWINTIEKSIANYALQIYSLRENQVNYLVKYLNYYLKEFNLGYKINVKLIDNFYEKNISNELFIHNLANNRNIDQLIGGSKIGPHKSDYHFYINDEYPVSQLSTGQQKTLVLLLYLSQCKYLIDILNKNPILLLDEICSHLDDINRSILLSLVSSFESQVFMTGTTKELFSFLSTNTNFYNITN